MRSQAAPSLARRRSWQRCHGDHRASSASAQPIVRQGLAVACAPWHWQGRPASERAGMQTVTLDLLDQRLALTLQVPRLPGRAFGEEDAALDATTLGLQPGGDAPPITRFAHVVAEQPCLLRLRGAAHGGLNGLSAPQTLRSAPLGLAGGPPGAWSANQSSAADRAAGRPWPDFRCGNSSSTQRHGSTGCAMPCS